MRKWIFHQIEQYWELNKQTRRGQAFALFGIGFLFSLLGVFADVGDLTPQMRIMWFFGIGLGTGIMLNLLLLLPAMFLSFVARRKKTGKQVWYLNILLVVYLVLLVPVIFLGALALAL